MLLAGLVVVSCSGPPVDDPDGPIPAPPDASTTTSTTVETFAVNVVFLGEAPRDGTAATSMAWTEFGYDLDHHVTLETSVDVCTPIQGAPRSVQVDGDEGTDNSWGLNILPIVQTAAGANYPSQDVTAEIAAGNGTLEIQVTGLSDDPHQTATGLSAQVFLGGTVANPSFTPSFEWPVTPSSVNDGASVASGAVVQFDTVYITDGTVVAVGAAPLTIPAALRGFVVPLVVHHPILTFRHVAAVTAAAADGVIAGVIDAEEFINSVKVLVGRISPSLCGSAFSGIANQFRQQQDILSDGTNEAGVPCSGISGGIGFTAVRIANPTQVGTELSWTTDGCDAGADATPDATADASSD